MSEANFSALLKGAQGEYEEKNSKAFDAAFREVTKKDCARAQSFFAFAGVRYGHVL